MQQKKRRWPVVLAVAAVLIVAVMVILPMMRQTGNALGYKAYEVANGDIETTVTGSGTLLGADTLSVEVPGGLKIDRALARAGDLIEEGGVIASLDPDSVRELSSQLSAQIAQADRNLRSMSANKTVKSVSAPVEGRIKKVYVEAGDDVSEAMTQQGAVMLLSTDGLMRVQIKTDEDLSLSGRVRVQWDGGYRTGDIAMRTDDGYIVTLEDKTAPYGGTAEVLSGDKRLGEGILEINAPMKVLAPGGTVKTIHYSTGAYIYAGTKLLTLDNGPMTDDYQQQFIGREKLAEDLKTVMTYQLNPYIRAPKDGVVRELFTSDKQVLGTALGPAAQAAMLETGGVTKLEVEIDELDISEIKLGQTARVRLDAISSEAFEASVVRISRSGIKKGSGTSYTVELQLEEDARFFAGMNANAVILIERVQDVPVIPIELIHEDESGIYVFVSPGRLLDGSDRVRADIKTGRSDGINTQVLSGLETGDTVLYQEQSAGQMLMQMRRMQMGDVQPPATGGEATDGQ
ncbi:MAG: HlyD family efflux transporter periplasmic adaptor subunit [Christensenellales bacterium]|jgi:HlyD family secretion protein